MFENSPVFSSYSVKNIDEARTFYRDVLGCDVKDVMMGIQMDFSNGSSVYIYQKEDHEPASFTVLNFPVDDIDSAIEELRARGIEMLRYDFLPGEQDEKGVLRGKAAAMGPDIAWFNDPAGNVLAVLEV